MNYFNNQLQFFQTLFSQSTPIVLWVSLLVIGNLSAIIFIKEKVEAKWVFWLFLGNGVFMGLLHLFFGYVRLLGLSHVLFWTPLVIYLWRRRGEYEEGSFYKKWVYFIMIINSLSLILDYIDVVRYFLKG